MYFLAYEKVYLMAPRLQTLSLRQLRALAAVAERGSVTGAADRLNLTQPAISLQLRNLQDSAGLPLLERTAGGMAANEAGAALLLLHDRVAAAIADCAQTLDMIAGVAGGRVAIGVVSTAKYFAPFAIAAFARAHPGVEVRLTVGNRDEIVRGLADFSLDVAIIGRTPPELDVTQTLIGDHPHVVIAPPRHPLARRRQLAVADLAAETFLIREPGSGTRALMERVFAEAGLAPRIGMEITSNETIKQAVMAGLGLAFISAHTISAELTARRLATLPVEGLPVVRQWFVVSRRDRVLLPPAMALVAFMGREAATFLPPLPPTAVQRRGRGAA
jgi:LysR family transcriptional regulator for metE and metH